MKKAMAVLVVFALALSLAPIGWASEAENALEEVFPQEDARRAAIVAMTNAQATDVFTEDGSDYDPVKFHSYADTDGFHLTVHEDGSWSAKDEKTWHVEDLKLKLSDHDTYMKVTMDVSFDGENYIASGVTKVMAGLEYLDSDDPSKINIEKMEPSESAPFLTVSSYLITEDREQSDKPSAGVNTADRSEWISGQFSIWDGSHKVLTDIVKRNLNDEKSFDHISTDYIDVSDGDMMDLVNGILETAGYSQRVAVGDLFIMMEFSAKNAFNATIKNTAFGIASYASDTVELIGIE